MILHAGLIALRAGGDWRGALIQGPSGAGKSDLALRALDAGFRLVADDRVLVWLSGGAHYGRAPDTLRGLIEARGQGLWRESPLPLCRIVVALACVADGVAIERMPEPEIQIVAGKPLPRLTIDPREASAPAKVRRAIEHLGAAGQQAYLAASLGGRGRAGTGDTH